MQKTVVPQLGESKNNYRLPVLIGAALSVVLSFLVYSQNIFGVVPQFFFSTHRDGSEALVIGKILADREGIETPNSNLGYFVMGDLEQGGDVLRSYDLLKGSDILTPYDYTDDNWMHGIARNWDGFFVLKSANSVIGYKADAFPLGARLLWVDGTQRTIDRVEAGTEYINIFVSKPLAGAEIDKPRTDIKILDYNQGRVAPKFIPYSSQYGIQGVGYSALQKVFSFDSVESYQSIAAILLAIVIVFISFYLGKAVSPILGFSFFLLSVFSPWVPSFARNLYWSPFLWYLPAVVVLIWHWQQTAKPWLFLPLLFTAFLVKFLSGYEYMTVVMLFAASIFVMAPTSDGNGKLLKGTLKNISIVLGIGLLAFLSSLVIHALTVSSSFWTGLDIVRERAMSRTVGVAVESGSGTMPNIASVLTRYIFGWDIPVFSITGQYTFAIMIVLALLTLGIRAYLRDSHATRDTVALILMSCIPLSWLVLALNHSAVHTHMNFVVWYVGFMPYVLYLFLDGTRAIFLKLLKPRSSGKQHPLEVEPQPAQVSPVTKQPVVPLYNSVRIETFRKTIFSLVPPMVFVLGMLLLSLLAMQSNNKVLFSPHPLSDENWTNGVSNVSAGFFFKAEPSQPNPVALGDTFVFNGSGERKVTKVVQLGEWTNIYLDGAPLNPKTDGYPNRARLVRLQSDLTGSWATIAISGTLVVLSGFLVLALVLWFAVGSIRGKGVLVVLMFTVLCLPTLVKLGGVEPQVKVVENRPATPMPEFDPARPEQFASQYVKFYNDTFGFRNLLVKWFAWIKFGLFQSSPTESIIVGKEGMTFYNSDFVEGNHSVGNYRRLSRLDDEKVAAIWSVLGATAEALKAKGIGFAFMITPDKSSVYPDRMPSQFAQLSGLSLIDQIMENSAVVERCNIIDLRGPLMEARKLNDVYYTHGTHWNQFGALIGFLELQKSLRSTIPSLPEYSLEDFSLTETIGSTDSMLVWVGLQEEFKSKEVIVSGPKLAKPNRVPKVLFYGDSFYSWIENYLSLAFDKVSYKRYGSPFQLDTSLIETEKPDFVVLEITERFIEKSF